MELSLAARLMSSLRLKLKGYGGAGLRRKDGKSSKSGVRKSSPTSMKGRGGIE